MEGRPPKNVPIQQKNDPDIKNSLKSYKEGLVNEMVYAISKLKENENISYTFNDKIQLQNSKKQIKKRIDLNKYEVSYLYSKNKLFIYRKKEEHKKKRKQNAPHKL